MFADKKQNVEFSYHIVDDPDSFDPLDSSVRGGSYVADALYLPLLRDQQKPAGAVKCEYKNKLTVLCALNPNVMFSDGKNVEAIHYVYTFHRMFTTSSPQAEHFMILKNAKDVYSGKLPKEKLGVHAQDKYTLKFELDQPDYEFNERLIDSSITPRPDLKALNGFVTAGLYVLEEFKSGRYIKLKPNPFPFDRRNDRPAIRILIVPDDETARSLFDTGRMSFLRRMSVDQIPVYNGKHPGFFFSPFYRMDYIGFHPKKVPRELRKALSEAPNYPELKKLYHALGLPSCPAIPEKFFDKMPCLPSNVVPKDKYSGPMPAEKDLVLAYSRAGGADIDVGMQWLHNQWKKKLGITVNLNPMEQKVMFQQLKVNPPTIFRRGVNLSRATCLAALENFKTGAPNNFISFQDKEYDSLLVKMAETKDEMTRMRLCRQGFELLYKESALIPMGEIYYSMVSDKKFDGFKISPLNQLDLTDLRLATK